MSKKINFNQGIKESSPLFNTSVGHHLSDMKHEMDAAPELLNDIVSGSPATDKALGIKADKNHFYKSDQNKQWKSVSASSIKNVINTQYKQYKGILDRHIHNDMKHGLSKSMAIHNNINLGESVASKSKHPLKLNKKHVVSHNKMNKKRILSAKRNRGMQR